MATTTDVLCVWCAKIISVRVADIKRGWGKYCSKSCKAFHQTIDFKLPKNNRLSFDIQESLSNREEDNL